ncbi:MAG: glycine oxidase ThiO [Nitrosomonas sp.]|nr:glycine oxidase ThiO [Nitrosomonas sp.]
MKKDFIVIGAGIVGLAMTARLLETGASVTLLERGIAGDEASWAGGGILSTLLPWDYSETVNQLAMYSASLYPQWTTALKTQTGIDPEYHVCGLHIMRPDRNHQTRALDWCAAHSVMIRQRLLTYDDPENISGHRTDQSTYPTLFMPEVAQVRNPRLLRALRQRIEQLHGNIIEHCEVSRLTTCNLKVTGLQTSHGQLTADQYILTAGAWSSRILGEHALNLDIRPIRGQILLYRLPHRTIQSVVVEQAHYLIPRQDGHILVGSTTEDTGFNKQTTTDARNRLSDWAGNLLPALRNTPLLQHWAGLRPASPGNLPTIGRHPALKNFYVNSGHFRYGMTMAPGSTEILLNEIEKRKQPFAISPYQQGWQTAAHRSASY